MQTAKLFMNGRSQAVRLPKQFRFEGEQVRIFREGRRVVLEPLTPERDAEFWASFGAWDEPMERLDDGGPMRDPFASEDGAQP